MAERAISAHRLVGDLDLLARRPRAAARAAICGTRRAREVEAVAAVDDRRQDLVGLGRGEHEDRVRRRLLERLEERVPRRGGEHVRLVEDVDLVAAGDRRVGDLLAQVADVVDRVVRRGVHLDHVERRGGRRSTRQDSHTPHGVIVGPVARSSARRRGSSPSTSCPCRASRRTGTRGGPCPARSRCAACAPRAPGRRRRRTCAGGGGGTAKRRPAARTVESSARPGPPPASAGARKSGPCTLRRSRFPGRVRCWSAPARATPHRLSVTA